LTSSMFFLRVLRSFIFYSMLISTCLFSPANWAQNVEASLSVREQIPDIRIVVDISGSMKKSDPKNLRIPATELLVNLLPQGSKAGIWTFGQYVSMLVPLGTVDEQWKNKARKDVKKINSVAMRTNIGEALLKASVGWEKPDPRYSRSLIILTDGVVDVSANMADNYRARERVLDTILPQLRAQQVSINTIALSESADAKLMQNLALGTEGKFYTLLNPEDLIKAFANTFDKVVPLDQVPIKGNQFPIDSSVDEFTALIFTDPKSPPTYLQTPSGNKIGSAQVSKDIKWFHANNYDLITVIKPEAGQWHLLADSDLSNRVTVISDLKLEVDSIPVNILSGERVGINMSLLENGKLLSKSSFLDIMEIQVSQRHAGGQEWSASLGGASHKGMTESGKFYAKFGKTLIPGEHQFTIQVDGKTFQRQNVQQVTVIENPLKVSHELGPDASHPLFHITVTDEHNLLLADKTDLLFHLSDKRGTKQDITLKRNEKNQWQGDVEAFSGLGTYSYTISVTGLTQTMRSVDYETPVQSLLYDAQGLASAANEASAEETDKVAPELDDSAVDKNPQTASDEKGDAATASNSESGKESKKDDVFSTTSTGTLVACLLGINLALVVLGIGAYKLVRKLRLKKETESDQDENQIETKPTAEIKRADSAADTLGQETPISTVSLPPQSAPIREEKKNVSDEVELDVDAEAELNDLDLLDSQTDETDLESIELDESILDDNTDVVDEAVVESPPKKASHSETAKIKPKESNDKKTSQEEKKDLLEDEIDLDEDFDLDIDVDELLDK
jgi:uncharacterized protein (TIGR03503 family)